MHLRVHAPRCQAACFGRSYRMFNTEAASNELKGAVQDVLAKFPQK